MEFLLTPIAMKIVTVLAFLDVLAVFAAICWIVGGALKDYLEQLREERRIIELLKDPIWFDLEKDA